MTRRLSPRRDLLERGTLGAAAVERERAARMEWQPGGGASGQAERLDGGNSIVLVGIAADEVNSQWRLI